jgi:Nitrile hydratase beta subunit
VLDGRCAGRDDWQYYEHWLTALERVLVEHGLVKPDELPDLPQ